MRKQIQQNALNDLSSIAILGILGIAVTGQGMECHLDSQVRTKGSTVRRNKKYRRRSEHHGSYYPIVRCDRNELEQSLQSESSSNRQASFDGR